MNDKPLTAEELDEMALLARAFRQQAALGLSTNPGILCETADFMDALIATARLAPRWRPGTEPPDTAREVLAFWDDIGFEVVSYQRGDSAAWLLSTHPRRTAPIVPDSWTDLPAPPK